MRLILNFADSPILSLTSTSFEHPLRAGKLTTIRGKSDGGLFGAGSFQWTAAVQALCLLFVETAIAKISDDLSPPAVFLEGKKGSHASSLAYALAKRPNWITDMFGIDSMGNPLLARLLRVVNPGRKWSDTVFVGLQGQNLAGLVVIVNLNNRLVTDARSLKQIHVQLLLNTIKNNPRKECGANSAIASAA